MSGTVAGAAKRGRGRPSRGISETTLQIRCSRALRDAVHAAAGADGKAYSEWVRLTLAEALDMSVETARHQAGDTPPKPWDWE